MAEQETNLRASAPAALEAPAFSNGIRLNLRQWLGVGVFVALLVVFAPVLWKQWEEIPDEPDYRMPQPLSEDYWLYQRFADQAARHDDILVLGDSVIWGEYAQRHETLSHFLNERGGVHCANLGLLGAHPLALAGLVEFYAESIRDKKVLLECNPLWLSSLQADMQEGKIKAFSHPHLMPQFVPRVLFDAQEISPRLGILVEQRFPFAQWTKHLQLAYYQADIPLWTLAHPYDNPLAPLAKGLPAVDDTLRQLPLPWFKSGIPPQDYPWIDLDTSLQWHAFRRVVEILQQRGNRVLVMVGPFNEHLLTPASLRRHRMVKTTIKSWLEENRIEHWVPEPLPSEQYGDASHPLPAGYARLARLLEQQPFFSR